MEEKRKTADEQEKRTLEFWREKKIYEKSVKRNEKGGKFYFMDGPPYATGHIHMGTALNKILKDIAMRSQRLQGKSVFDRAGYDTHGVPIEYQIEKEIGSKSKQDIEKFGVKKFIEKCKDFATKFIGVMNSEFENLGAWMDFKNPYLTLSNEYVETIWDTFKEADKKKLLYLGKYPVHVCPRCETAVAFNEIEYANQEDNSVFVKFPVKDRKKTFLLIWTTTPWTLPANTGVMVHPDFKYSEIELSSGETWIIASGLVPKIMTRLGLGYTLKKEFKGKEMKGWQYLNPLSKNLKLKTKNAYKVVLSGRYVNLEEGTGLVHCAPGHGKEDYEVGKEYGLDMPSPVAINGLMTEEAGKYSGKKARIVDDEIMNDLENDNCLVYRMKYIHDYPLCWRCKSPLLMIAMPQWFLKISEIQKEILRENEKTEWNPKWMKTRMKAWLEGISDWPVSRNRYWGTPLPIWKCSCGEKIVIGSIDELEKASGKKVKEVHRPEIDEIKIKCRKCGKEMLRVSEVLDVWFDSGVSSWAALNYMHDKNNFKKFWPADLNIEGKDQVRGWWNSQFILSQIKFGRKPFENIVEHGMILDIGRKKMSKSMGNITAPKDVIEKYGRDYLRYYFAKTSKGEDFAFDEEELKASGKIFMLIGNINNFVNQTEKSKSKNQIEDRWIESKFNLMVKQVLESYNQFKFPEGVQMIEQFLIEDLSKTYIKIIRERSNESWNILNEMRINLLKLLAPVIPFLTEKIWQELKKKKIVKEESVHLSEFPRVDEKKIDKKLEEEFSSALKIIELGMAARDKEKIGLKWPLAKAIITIEKPVSKELQEIISRQLNVKKIEIKKGKEMKVELNTEVSEELELEGYAREISRNIQAERKKAGLVKENEIELVLVAPESFVNKIKLQEKFIEERVNAKNISILSSENEMKKKFKCSSSFKVKDIDFRIYFSKV